MQSKDIRGEKEMKRRIRKNENDGRQEIQAKDKMTSAEPRQKGWKPRDESERQRSIERAADVRDGRIHVSYVERQEVPRVFVSRGTRKGCARGTDPRGGCK